MDNQTIITICLVILHAIGILALVAYFSYSRDKKNKVKQQYAKATDAFEKSILERNYATLKHNDYTIIALALVVFGGIWYFMFA